MKFCNSCDTEKDESDFGKRKASKDGLSAKCRTCQRVYDKARSKDKHREEARRIYAQTDEGRLAGNKAKAAYRKRNPKKTRAHAILGRSVRAGHITKEPCEVCGSDEVAAHHDDYDIPLRVRWLCSKHHNQWHAEHGEGKNPT